MNKIISFCTALLLSVTTFAAASDSSDKANRSANTKTTVGNVPLLTLNNGTHTGRFLCYPRGN